MNIVRDYNLVQGVTHPSDIYVRRNINVRYITVESSSKNPVNIAITATLSGDVPQPNFMLAPGEVRQLAINPQGMNEQWLWMLDVESGLPVGKPQLLARHANSFVLRQGINGWFAQRFHRAVYNAAH